jgi:two-component system cell cycle response regulator CpdR
MNAPNSLEPTLFHMVAIVQGDRRATSSPMSRVVLVVDDMPSVSEVMAIMLEDLGCEVLTASTGNKALSMLAQKHVDVLIADIDMPGMKGTELARRATGHSPNLKVLLVSGGLTNAQGFTVLQKPFDQAGLKSAMEKTTGLC